MTRRQRLAARLGLDGNVLRRRTDKIASCGAAGLLAAFLVGAPLLAAASGRWADRMVAAEQRAERGWHQVTAVLLDKPPASGDGLVGPVRARWTAPAGHHRVGVISVLLGTPAGTHIPIWVDAAGRSTWPPLRAPATKLLVGGAIAAAPVVLAVALLGVAFLGRRLLDWRRLAAWETAWTSVGPRWTRQFWARE
jgi:hypothetical protein